MGLSITFAAPAVSFASCLLMIRFLYSYAHAFGLTDSPCERKVHTGNIPLIGGIAIFSGVACAVFASGYAQSEIFLLLFFTFLLLVVGIVDDFKGISPRKRLILQGGIILGYSLASGVSLCDFGDIFFIGKFEIPAGFSHLLTLLALYAGINAFNMLDGIDGLAASTSIVSFLALAFIFSSSNTYFLLCLVFVAALAAFLLVNLGITFSRFKIFMGDAGSTTVGFVVGFLLILASGPEKELIRPVTSIWIIGLPLMDMVGVILRRLMKFQSPMAADRNHLHHILLLSGFSHQVTLIVLILVSSIFAIIGLFGDHYKIHESIMVLLFLLSFGCYFIIVSFLKRQIHSKCNCTQL